VNRQLAGETHQQVSAARRDGDDDAAGEVDGRQLGHAEVGAPQRPAGERGVQSRGDQVDGIALRHAGAVPCRYR
jgi:hypothetical protein